MNVFLAAYSLAIATVYALLYVASPRAASALMLFFVIAVLLPAAAKDLWRRHD